MNEMRGDFSMKLSRLRRVTTGAALAFVFLFSMGIVTGTTAQAQDRNRRWDRNDRDGDRNRGDWYRRQQIERARTIERARAIERARQLAWQRERERARSRNSYPRAYPNGGYGSYGGEYGGYGNGGYGNGGGYGGGSNSEVQKGFRDGLDRGQEDLRDRRSPNPNNSSHYRSGNGAYRDGFRRGYEQGYRQFGGNRGW